MSGEKGGVTFLEPLGKASMGVVQVLGALGVLAAMLGGWFKLPSRVDALDDQVQDLPIIRAQLDWTTRVMSDRFKVDPPDLSRFERPRRRRER